MRTLRPGETADLGPGERLVLHLSGPGAGDAVVGTEAGGDTQLDRRAGRWTLEGPPGCSGLLFVAGRGGAALSGRVSIELTVVGGPEPRQQWQITDLELAGRTRVDVLDASRETGGAWSVRSRQMSGPEDEGLVVSPPQAVGARGWSSDPITLHLAVAFDRSASMRWAYESAMISSVIADVENARRVALSPASAVRWLTYGSGVDTDLPAEVDDAGVTPEQLAQRLTPLRYSSGSRLGSVVPLLAASQLLVVVTDRFPVPEELADAGGCELTAAILLGVPADRASWPVDWSSAEAALAGAGVRVLPLEGASPAPTTGEWLFTLFSAAGPR